MRKWVADKLFNINGVVDDKIHKHLENIYKVKTPGKEQEISALFNYRQQEYKTWSLDSASKLLEFYKTKLAPQQYMPDRLLFWSWVGGVNVPKLHYSAPQRIINQMKSLLFSQEIEYDIDTGNKKANQELRDKIDKILKDNNFYELLQKSVNYETYSGTLAWKPIMDTDISESPIIDPYPAENILFKAEKKRPQEIIYVDNYTVRKNNKDVIYHLKSIYGKGYIKYELWTEGFKKRVAIETVPELAEYKNIAIVNKDGEPIPILLSAYKKNREVNSEFPESLYGGSDFQGITDSFQLIDELYSQKQLVVRRSRPIIRILEEQLGYDANTGKVRVPKEFEFDTIITRRASDLKEDGRIDRDVPDLKTKYYDEAIQEELKNIFATIGMAYTTVGLEAHSANISGVALENKEKATVIIRNNKIRLWKQFLKENLRLLLIFNSLKEAGKIEDEENGTIIYQIDDTFDYDFKIEFPNFYDLDTDEKVDSVVKMINAGIMDRKTAFKRVFGEEYDDEEMDEIIRNAKLESGIALLEADVSGVEEVVDTDQITEVVEEV